MQIGAQMARDELWSRAYKVRDDLEKKVANLSPELKGQWEIYLSLGGDRALAMRDRMVKNPDLLPLVMKDDEVRALSEIAQEGDPEAAFKAYRRTAGETEARNVQTRMDMTAAERRAKAPWTTQDVPDDQQIVRFR
jgi:hypothetical protein